MRPNVGERVEVVKRTSQETETEELTDLGAPNSMRRVR